MLSGRITAVMVHCPAPAEALAWYEQALPAARRVSLEAFNFTFLQLGELRIEFVPSDEKVGAGPAGTVVYWEVEDFQAALRGLRGLGASLYRGPMAIENGQSMCQVQDPWGNCIGIRGPGGAPPAPRQLEARAARPQQLVVLSGLPASGKSTVGRAIAGRLGVPFVDKDELLEQLFVTRGVGDVEHRRALSREADGRLRNAVAQLPRAVITSWWRHPASTSQSGTEPWWLNARDLTAVEVYCTCPARIAAARFLARSRHAGHLDARWNDEELLRSFVPQAALGPITPGALVVPTEQEVTHEVLEDLAASIACRLSEPGGA